MIREPFYRGIFEALKGVAKELPSINLTEDASQSIVSVVRERKPNQLSETPFLGIESGGRIVEIVTSPGLLADSRLTQVSASSFTIAVDKNQLAEQFNKAYQSGKLEAVTLLGHLHPSGETTLDGTTYIVSPSESLLKPSMEDIGFARSFMQLNQDSKIKHFGIAANTPSGPQLAVWKVDDLVKVKKFRDLEKIPMQKIDLTR